MKLRTKRTRQADAGDQMAITVPSAVHICILCKAEPACGIDEYGDPAVCYSCEDRLSRPCKPPIRSSVRFGVSFLVGVTMFLVGVAIGTLCLVVALVVAVPR
jgi:hypothetical protein